MKNLTLFLILSTVLVSCTFSTKEKVQDTKKEALIMYKSSEMALLMRDMFQTNLKLKKAIIQQDSIGIFPQRFEKIHQATLTDPSDRTASFNSFSKAYILNHQEIYKLPSQERKEQFNTMVNTCIACHETTCVGLIPKIKKLVLK